MRAAALFVTLTVGLLLRLYRFDTIALWHDEAVSLWIVVPDWGEAMRRVRVDFGPPLYFVLLKLWCDAFGASLEALRLFSVACGTLSIWAGYRFLLDGGAHRRVALVAGALVAAHPLLVDHGREGRFYAFGVLLILTSCWVLVRALAKPSAARWCGYAASVVACLYTHYFLVFSIAAQGLALAVLAWRPSLDPRLGAALGDARGRRAAALAFFGACAAFLPWVPEVLEETRIAGADFWMHNVTLGTVAEVSWRMMVGGLYPEMWKLVAGPTLAVVLVLYSLVLGTPWVRLLAALAAAAPFGSLLVPAIPVTLDRYFIFGAAFVPALAAYAVHDLGRPRVRTALATALTVAAVGIVLDNWRRLDAAPILGHGPVRRPGMAAAAAFVNRAARPTDRIVVASSLILLPFKYYNHTGIAPRLHVTVPYDSLPHYAGRAMIAREEVFLDWNEMPRGARVWLIWTNGFWQPKPVVPPTWRRLREEEFVDTPHFKSSIFVTEYVVVRGVPPEPGLPQKSAEPPGVDRIAGKHGLR
jgi:hypothetical protein